MNKLLTENGFGPLLDELYTINLGEDYQKYLQLYTEYNEQSFKQLQEQKAINDINEQFEQSISDSPKYMKEESVQKKEQITHGGLILGSSSSDIIEEEEKEELIEEQENIVPLTRDIYSDTFQKNTLKQLKLFVK